ncbi:cysteine proteinase [Dothidotthia symphoricarpi CBS 119687]|uniref:Cysteine proteinase n=1 Tax=Dothidotthia symphoricarpi CBS 119687 TaxID=1392245 RepID=A0A6A6AQK1_9PLEO|nr:cysteine proteinase [Dothidotthia symphoricarpi CBS 119687]KAF2134272.1 cysteine proteinase [Dothidotthia symphoricarpi CBS 119687]
MSKRQALEPLEEVYDAPSPALKRARVEDEEMESPPPEGAITNGYSMPLRLQDQGKMDIVGAEAEEHADDDDENEPAIAVPKRQTAPEAGYTDLYLDTIARKVLDFDFEKLCSVTLSNINVYACLVCGKYYQGRGPKSQAYFHALEEGHHVYVNMETKKVYVLPEGYEVKSKSLEDIKFVVDPRMSKTEVARLDKDPKVSWDLSNKEYIPGFIGMNNIKANDYFNVVVQALSHVAPLRNFFMLEDLSSRPQLAQRFSTLVRKIWNPRAFKTHVSPHELLQEVGLRSSKRFTLSEQSDPVDFLSWFLNNLHLAVGGSKTKPGSSIVQKVFQGSLKIESQEITARADAGDRLRFEDADVKTEISKFLVLTLDLPAAPLFQDALEKNIIPQVPLTTILGKYNGMQPQEKMKNRVRYRLLHPLPPYLLMNIKRFSKNKFVSERNPTIVTFPVQTPLDMSPYVEPNPREYPPGEPIWYDLVANITHEAVKKKDDSVEGEQESKVWRVQLKDRSRDDWYGIQDLFVEKERGETLFTKESYLQVWERRRGGKAKGRA